MDRIQNYDVAFSGLKEGKHQFKFEVDKEFFQLFDTDQEFTNPLVQVDVLLDKHSTFLEFEMRASGSIDLVCDVSNEIFPYSIEQLMKFLVKFGEEYDDSNEEVIIIPHHEYAFNIAQYVYEMVMLSVPMKKLSPSYQEDENEMGDEQEEEIKEVDPRWEVLKRLKEK